MCREGLGRRDATEPSTIGGGPSSSVSYPVGFADVVRKPGPKARAPSERDDAARTRVADRDLLRDGRCHSSQGGDPS